MCRLFSPQMSNPRPNRRRKREAHAGPFCTDLIEDQDCVKRSEGRLRDLLKDALDMLPADLVALVIKSVTLPYEYKWNPRPNMTQVNIDGKTLHVDAKMKSVNVLTSTLVTPSFPIGTLLETSREYIADWLIHCPIPKYYEMSIFAGIGNPQAL